MMAEDKAKVEYVVVKGCEECTYHTEGEKITLKDATQKQLAKLYKLGVKEVATK